MPDGIMYILSSRIFIRSRGCRGSARDRGAAIFFACRFAVPLLLSGSASQIRTLPRSADSAKAPHSEAEDVEEAPEIEEAKLFVALVRCAATVGSFALPHANEAAVIGTPNQSFIDTS